MAIIRRTRASLRDYEEIWEYVAADNIAAADKLLRLFDRKLKLLADFPHAGPARPELRPGVRSFPVGRYLLFYRTFDGGVELLRVLHGSRDVRRILRRSVR